MTASKQQLLTDLQTHGVQVLDPTTLPLTRKGGAGPSDHQAMVVDGQTIMVPVHTHSARQSPFSVQAQSGGRSRLLSKGIPVADISFAQRPRFYEHSTADGIPYSHIATLHSRDVLATTVLQNCIRYDQPDSACQFCSIGQSLASGKTIAHKTPQQLAEVAAAAVALDGVKHMVMTTGTPATHDRGARVLCDSVRAVKAAVDLPIQVQCEPPKDLIWLQRLREAGADALGLHLEVVHPDVRRRIMPSKANIPVSEYMAAFAYAVPLFGRGQVSTYILAGLGDTAADILALCDELIDLGVYPFVVPFVPIAGTQLEHHPAPDANFMHSILQPLGEKLRHSDLTSEKVSAGCARCGACSSLKSFERAGQGEQHESV
ncbi:MAG: MSMEG_0568 family radical SAM protein [Pseudomonadota bacterium]|nr:MSMEG_0568 family radical SAM protein [Pseudomonadota bacterium]